MFPTRERQRGTAELLVLALLRDRPMYGYQIVRELEARSEGYFAMEEGLLYPTLHRLERDALVRAEWRVVESRRRRYYALTEAGLAVLASATAEWATFLNRFLGILDPSGGNLHGEARPPPTRGHVESPETGMMSCAVPLRAEAASRILAGAIPVVSRWQPPWSALREHRLRLRRVSADLTLLRNIAERHPEPQVAVE